MANEVDRYSSLYMSSVNPLVPRVRKSADLRNFAPVPQGIEMTRTVAREEVMFRMMTRLADGRDYRAEELVSLFDNYPIGLFIESKDEAIIRDGILEAAHPDDIKRIMSYVLPRFVDRQHVANLNNAEIHFTDNPEDFYNDKAPKYVPNSRSRVYSHSIDKENKSHFTFLLRHNIKENYTDAFELVSFMGFIETAREYGKKHKDLDAGYQVHNLASGKGMTLSKRNMSLSKPYDVAMPRTGDPYSQTEKQKEVPIAMQDVVDKISSELQMLGIESPKHVMFGNDFSVPLLIGTGVIKQEEFDYIRAVAEEEARVTQMNSKIVSETEIERLNKDDDKEIIRQFSLLQYLNRYTPGKDVMMDVLAGRFKTAVSAVQKRIIQPTHTALGSYVDVIDFSGLNETIISQIDNEEIKAIVQNLKDNSFSYYSLPYPLGDSINGIVRAFNSKFNITNFGFFGKVGAVPVEGSKVARGRVVIPDQTGSMHMQRSKDGKASSIKRISNILRPNDAVIIKSADAHKVVVSVNGITMQSQEDIPSLKIMIQEQNGGEYADLLLDMEADYFNDVCIELGIDPAAIYYVSDLTLEKTPDPYFLNDYYRGHSNTIVDSLGAQGTLASLVSPFTILKKWLENYKKGIILKQEDFAI